MSESTEPTGPLVENPNEDADEEEGNEIDPDPVGTELLELGEVLEWEKAVEQSKQSGMGSQESEESTTRD